MIFALCAELKNACENVLVSNRHSSRAAPGISFFRTPAKDDKYRANWLFLVIGWRRQFKKQIKNQTVWVALSSVKYDMS